MAKVNYDAFRSFDINECCDHFDSEKQANWKKIGKFIVADGRRCTIIFGIYYVVNLFLNNLS